MQDASALDTLPPLREVIAAHDLRTKKSLGQHFLLDGNLTDKIVRQAGDLSGYTVIEVGPGPGGLTRSLLRSNAGRVIAIEKDARCIAALGALEAAAGGRLEVLQADATSCGALALGTAPRAVIANLPYNVGTELLVGWLHAIAADASCCSQLLLMFQREVAERISAAPGCKAYGRISVLAQFLCEVRVVLQVPAQAFTPPPKVESAVIQLIPRAQRDDAPLAALEKVVAIAFQQRRKMLRSSLKPLGAPLIASLEGLGIDPQRRPDQLSVAEYVALARRYDSLR